MDRCCLSTQANQYERESWKLGTPRGEYVRRRRLKGVLPLVGDATLVLDAGCGPATLSKDFPCKVVGVDISFDMMIRGRIESLIVADTQHLPFKDKSFDLSFESSCLYLVSDKLLMLGEMARVSRRRIVTFESNGGSLRRVFDKRIRGKKREHSHPTPAELKGYYRKLGLKPTIRMVGFAPFINSRLIFRVWRPIERLVETIFPLNMLTGGILVFSSPEGEHKWDFGET